MKVTELQIGDWVYEGSNHPIKVKHNYGRSIRYDEGDYSHAVEESCLCLIPLTTEILEKNGFERRGDWAMYFTSEDYDIMWRTDTNPTPHLTIESMTRRIGNFRSYNCNNVHELQHALRLCGLNYLADNFKVE